MLIAILICAGLLATMCVQKGEILEPRYSCIWPVECLLSRHELVALVGRDVIRELVAH